jgi:hypothetical protein
VLENVPEVKAIIEKIRLKAQECDIVLLDYNTNPENREASKPLSHAELVKMYIEGRYPQTEEDFRPWTPEELKALKKANKKKSTKIRVKVTATDLPNYLDEITSILANDERTATDLAKMLGIDIAKGAFEKFLEGIPHIIVEKVKRTKCFTLDTRDQESTLF